MKPHSILVLEVKDRSPKVQELHGIAKSVQNS